MENCTEDVIKNFKTYFLTLSPEDQYNLIVPLLTSTDGYLQWRIKSLLNSIQTSDLLTLLPPEVQFLILSLIDGSTLLKACQVSKRWNVVIKSYSQLWREKSKEIGVNIEEKPSHISWQKAFALSQKQLHLMEVGKAFKEKYVNLQNSRRAVKAVDYDHGYMCTVSEDDCINIWQLEMNIPVLSFLVDQSVSCIKFRRYSTLVCGHFTGILTSWDLSDISDHCFRHYDSRPIFEGDDRDFSEFSLLKAKYKMHSGPVFSCDFSEELQLLVSGSADEKIKFWCLKTGTLLYTLNSQSHWVLRLLLIPFDSSGDSHSILTMTSECVDKYRWPLEASLDSPSLDSLEGVRGNLRRIKVNTTVKLRESNDKFITPGLQISSKFIGFVKQDLQEKQATLELLDLNSFDPRISLSLNFKVRKLMALGNRFALLLTIGKVLYSSTLVVVDIHTGKTIGTHSIPHSKMTTPDGAQMIVGDTQWLDGLKGWEHFTDALNVPTPSRIRHDESYDVGENCDHPQLDKEDCTATEDGGSDVNIGVGGIASDIRGVVKEMPNSHRFEVAAAKRLSGRSYPPLVLAAGVRSEGGRVFTLWWGCGEEKKRKVD